MYVNRLFSPHNCSAHVTLVQMVRFTRVYGYVILFQQFPFGTVVRKNGSEGLGTVSDPTRAVALLKSLLGLVSSTYLLSEPRTSQMWTMNDIVFGLA